MEIKDMKMDDIQKRMAEINELLNAEDADVEALTEEVNQLEARANEIKANAEKRSELVSKIANGEIGKAVETHKEERKEMTEAEKRAENLIQNGKIEIRQLLASGRIAKPTYADGVSELADVADDIVDDVNAIPLTGTGAWTVGYQKTNAVAADVTDGSAVGGTAATYDYVTINPGEWGVLDEISKQVKKMTPLAYENAIVNAAKSALRAKASDKIVAAVLASTLVETKNSVLLDADYLKNIVLGFRAIKNKGATCLYIAQADLAVLGKVRGTNEKKALFEITFDAGTTTSGTIKEGGMAVRFRVLDQLTAGTQLFGQPKTIDMPMWDDYTVETDEGGDYFKRNMIGIRGLQTAGADVVAYHGMQVIKQAAAS